MTRQNGNPGALAGATGAVVKSKLNKPQSTAKPRKRNQPSLADRCSLARKSGEPRWVEWTDRDGKQSAIAYAGGRIVLVTSWASAEAAVAAFRSFRAKHRGAKRC
jgi:hypothetical protein